MEPGKLLCCASAALLLVMFLGSTTALGTTGLSLTVVFLGEPDIFVPGLGLSAEIFLTRSLGMFAGGAYFISGSWDLAVGVSWHATPRFVLQLQALFLFDVIDGFIPQLGAGMHFNFPLSGAIAFFNELSLNVPLVERFLQPGYTAGFALTF